WEHRPYSLGRFQMATWFCLILTSFLFIFVVTWDLNSITAESFILMGISGATALAAVAIDQSKDGPSGQAQKALDAMGLKTRAEVDKLYEKDVKLTDKASTKIPGANVPGKPDPTIGELRTEYENQTRDFRSMNVLKDLVNDVNGPTIHRWQILI